MVDVGGVPILYYGKQSSLLIVFMTLLVQRRKVLLNSVKLDFRISKRSII